MARSMSFTDHNCRPSAVMYGDPAGWFTAIRPADAAAARAAERRAHHRAVDAAVDVDDVAAHDGCDVRDCFVNCNCGLVM